MRLVDYNSFCVSDKLNTSKQDKNRTLQSTWISWLAHIKLVLIGTCLELKIFYLNIHIQKLNKEKQVH